MAAADDITRPEPPLRRRTSGECVYYTGSRSQLIAADIISPDDPLPGDPGQRKGYFRCDEHPRGIRAVWRRAGRFTVELERPRAEVEAEERERAQWQARHAFYMAQRGLSEKIRALPTTHEAFRESRGFSHQMLLGIAEWLLKPSGGFSFTEETRERVQYHVDGIIEAIAEGVTQFKRCDLDEEIEALRERARGADPSFKEFMGRIGGE